MIPQQNIKHIACALLFIGVLVMCIGCTSDILTVQPPVVKDLSGSVRRTGTSPAIANAIVECMGRTTLTDSAGRFMFKDLPMDPTRTIVRVYAQDMARATKAFVPTDSTVADYRIQMQNLPTTTSIKTDSGYVFSLSGHSVVLPPDAFATRLGTPYTGKVEGMCRKNDIGTSGQSTYDLGDNRYVTSDGQTSSLVNTSVYRYCFLGDNKDTIYVRANAVATIVQSVNLAPEFQPSMEIYTFDHGSAYWKQAGLAQRDSLHYKGTFVWGNDISMNYLRASRRPATIIVMGPDRIPLQYCSVSLSGRSLYTDSTGRCALHLVASKGTLVEVRDVTATDLLGTYSLATANETDPGEHVVVLSSLPVLLTGSVSHCNNTTTRLKIALSRISYYLSLLSPQSPFRIPIPNRPEFDVYAHDDGSAVSEVHKISPASITSGIVDVGHLKVCTASSEVNGVISLPSGVVALGIVCGRASNYVYVLATDKLLTYSSSGVLMRSVTLSQRTGQNDTALLACLITSSDTYLYVSDGPSTIDVIEIATGRIVQKHSLGGGSTRATLGADVDAELVISSRISGGNLILQSIGSMDGTVKRTDTVERKFIGWAFGVKDIGMTQGRFVHASLYQQESMFALSLDLTKSPPIQHSQQAYISEVSTSGEYLVTNDENGTVALFSIARNRWFPLPSEFYAEMFNGILRTSANEIYVAQLFRGRMSVADIASGRVLASKQILPPSLQVSELFSLSDSGHRVGIISGTRSNSKVYVIDL